MPTARPGRHARVLGAALLLVSGLLVAPIAAPAPVAGAGPLPACRLDDILTEPRDYDSGPTTFVDHIHTLGKHYAPPDLVPASNAGIAGGGSVRQIAIPDLRAMADAAAANGTPLGNLSSYRSYRQQKQLFRIYARSYGFDEATTFSARPGHSEHQLGLTFDFMAAGGPSPMIGDWATTPTGRWMKDHAWEYGWVMSFPKGKRDVTCFSYEPWHYRYVGRDVAREIHESGLTTREYLWEHYAQIDPSPGEPPPSGPAAPTGPPSPAATGEPSPLSPSTTGLPSSPAAPGRPPPTQVVGTLFGLEPAIAIGVLVVLGVLALAAIGSFRRATRRG